MMNTTKYEAYINSILDNQIQYIVEEEDDDKQTKYKTVLNERKKRESLLGKLTGLHSYHLPGGITGKIKVPCKQPKNKDKTCLNTSQIKKLAKRSVPKKEVEHLEKLLLKYILGFNRFPSSELITMLKYPPSKRAKGIIKNSGFLIS